MGMSTNGQVSYGVKFEEDYEFPWDLGDYDGDIDEWWLAESGFVRGNDYPFDEDGEYKIGLVANSPSVLSYFERESDWREAHPLPVEPVNYCSGEYPIYILAVVGSVVTANRGFPRVLNPSALTVTAEQHQALIDFCEKHGLSDYEGPSWYLSNYCS